MTTYLPRTETCIAGDQRSDIRYWLSICRRAEETHFLSTIDWKNWILFLCEQTVSDRVQHIQYISCLFAMYSDVLYIMVTGAATAYVFTAARIDSVVYIHVLLYIEDIILLFFRRRQFSYFIENARAFRHTATTTVIDMVGIDWFDSKHVFRNRPDNHRLSTQYPVRRHTRVVVFVVQKPTRNIARVSSKMYSVESNTAIYHQLSIEESRLTIIIIYYRYIFLLLLLLCFTAPESFTRQT